MQIAILEDNPGIGHILELGIGKAGHVTHLFQTVKDFLDFVGVTQVDLLIVDFRLEHGGEGRNGADVIREVRKTAPEMPAIIESAAPLSELQAACNGMARVQIIEKPFQVSHLVEIVQVFAQEP
jgi:DNA-binding response OmpR family regulator